MSNSLNQGVNSDVDLKTKTEKPIVSVGEARKLLGKHISKSVDDKSLQKIIVELEKLCRLVILNPQIFAEKGGAYASTDEN